MLVQQLTGADMANYEGASQAERHSICHICLIILDIHLLLASQFFPFGKPVPKG